MKRQELVERLRGGLVPAALTPLSAAGDLDRSVLERYLENLAPTSVALAVWAHTGRAPYLTTAQRETVLRTAVSVTKLPVIAGVTAPAGQASAEDAVTEKVLREAERAAELGAAGLLVFPPVALAADPEREAAARRIHERLARTFDLPLILFYLHGEAGGFPYSETLLRALLSIPQTAGIKLATLDAAVTCQDVIRLVREEFGDRLAITGEDRMYGPSFLWGAQAALVGIAAAATDLSRDVLEAWTAGDAARFVAASNRLDRLAAVTFKAPIEGYIQRMLWVAVWEGSIPEEAAHDPFGPALPPGERADVERVLESLAGALPAPVPARWEP